MSSHSTSSRHLPYWIKILLLLLVLLIIGVASSALRQKKEKPAIKHNINKAICILSSTEGSVVTGKITFIVLYLNYPIRYGFAYQLSDGKIGVSMRGDSYIVLHRDGTLVDDYRNVFYNFILLFNWHLYEILKKPIDQPGNTISTQSTAYAYSASCKDFVVLY